jgi:type I restriction enzyme, S subunit
MGVRPGYRQTQVGVIPEEWGVDALGKSCDVITKGTTPTSIGRAFTKSGVAFLKAESISESGKTIPEKVAYIDVVTHALMKRSQLKCDDVLISIAGVLGRVGFVEQSDLPANTNQALAIVRLGTKSEFECHFLFYALGSPYVSRQIRDINVRAAQANISLRDVRDFVLPIPPAPEQRAIATALSDVDALLAGLDRLITKKRALRQAAMQQLLTGQTRLPGFHGEWEEKKIAEFASCTAGGTPSTGVASYWGGPIRWMSSGELDRKRVDEVAGRITEAGLATSSATMLPAKCVLIGLAGQGKTRGTVAMNLVELCTNQSIAAVLPSPAFVPEYLYYNLDARYEELRELSTGAGGRGGLNLAIIRAVDVLLPEIAEQAAIATVLSDMDAELSALEARRAKTRDLKQAMMSELLTGKTRLPYSEAVYV